MKTIAIGKRLEKHLIGVRKRHAIFFYVTVAYVLGAYLLVAAGCTNGDGKEEGEVLSKKYCASCHSYPEPSLLPKDMWSDHVLPVMGAFADLSVDKDGNYQLVKGDKRDPAIENVRFSIPLKDWNKIVAFYQSHAPDSLNVPVQPIGRGDLAGGMRLPGRGGGAPFTTCVSYDTAARLLFQASLTDNRLNIYTAGLQLSDSLPDCRGVVDVEPLGKEGGAFHYLLTHIGSIKPSENRNGLVEEIAISEGRITGRTKICDSLYRPVQAVRVDVDRDGRPDIVVCEFGYMSGQLSLFRNLGNGKYQQSILSAIAGAEKIIVQDINGDGLPDLWVLFAHDIEGIFQFLNKGGAQFEPRQVLSFPPCYGSTSFQLADMDGDGLQDIIYTCGDNADYSPVLKPYHGVYIFRKTDSGYRQVFFRQVNGCYKALPLYMKPGGRPDLAVISFFADYARNPAEGFQILHFDTFSSFTDPEVATMGRWICMDVKDIDGDGVPEVILGNMAAKAGTNPQLSMEWMKGPAFVVLHPGMRTP